MLNRTGRFQVYFLFSMKIISYNIRGLGGKIKKKEISKLIHEHSVDLICLQETKMEEVSSQLCLSLWAGDDFDWSFKPVVGRSGGLLMLWRSSVFSLEEAFVGEHFLGVRGRWGENKTECTIINVYVPATKKKKVCGAIY